LGGTFHSSRSPYRLCLTVAIDVECETTHRNKESKDRESMDGREKIQLQLRIRMKIVCECGMVESLASPCDVYNGFLFGWKNR
jgi:hypothetical protein